MGSIAAPNMSRSSIGSPSQFGHDVVGTDRDAVLFCGILHKRKNMTFWKKRMFKLFADGNLRWFEGPTDTKVKGEVPVLTIQEIEIEKDQRYFKIKTNGSTSTWRLFSDEPAGSIRWAEALQSAHPQGRRGIPVSFAVKSAQDAKNMTDALDHAGKVRSGGKDAWNQFQTLSEQKRLASPGAAPEQEAPAPTQAQPLVRRISAEGQKEIDEYLGKWGAPEDPASPRTPAERIKADRMSKELEADLAPAEQAVVAVEEPAACGLLCKDDENLVKYFKMKRMRIPEQSVKEKMEREGHDPNLLDTPDALSPYA